jgi:hypothetical protein
MFYKMKIIFLLSLVFSLPALSFGSSFSRAGTYASKAGSRAGTYLKSLKPAAFEPLNPQISSESLDGLLKSAGNMAPAVKNPQIIVHQTGTNAAGEAIHGVTVQSAKIGDEAFKPGFAQVVGLDGKKAHFVKIDRLNTEGADIKRLRRLYGLDAQKLTAKEAAAIGVGATAILGGTGATIGAISNHRNKKFAEEDLAFQIAHGADFSNSGF